MNPLNVFTIKEKNVSAIYHALLNCDMERSELARKVGVSIMTVGNLTDPLLKEKILVEQKVKEKVVGRKPFRLSVCESGNYMVILDITAKKFQYKLLNMTCKVVEEEEYILEGQKSLEKEFRYFLKFCMEKTAVVEGKIIGVGVATPGCYQPDFDIVSCKALPELESFQMKKTISEYFDTDILIDEDVKLAAYSFLFRRDVENMVYLYAGEGIGASLVVNGMVYNGTRRFSGEIGQINYQGTTYEQKACFPSFLEKVKKCFPEACKESAKVGAQMLWQERNPYFLSVLGEFADCFAEMLSVFYYILDPELFVLDGDYKMFGQGWTDMIKERTNHFMFGGINLELAQEIHKLPNHLNGLAIQTATNYVASL